MEKIQVELNTLDHLDVEDVEHESCKSHLRGDQFLHQRLKELQDVHPTFTLSLEPLFIDLPLLF